MAKKEEKAEETKTIDPALPTIMETVRLCDLETDHDAWAFRNLAAYATSSKSIKSLAESIRLNGLLEPLKVIRRNGTLLIVEGHRRKAAMDWLVSQNLMKADAPVKVVVYEGAENDLDVLKRVGSLNLDRQKWDDHGIIRYAGVLARKNCPKNEISRILGKSEKQVDRYLLLANCKWMMGFVGEHYIGATAASNLLELANNDDKQSELQRVIGDWAANKLKEIAADNAARTGKGGKAITGDRLYPKKYITKELLATWKQGLSDGNWGDVSVKFMAGIETDSLTKRRRLKIDAFAEDVETLNLEKGMAVFQRLTDCTAEMEPLLLDLKLRKQIADEREGKTTEGSPGARRLAALGIVAPKKPSDGETDPSFSDTAGRMEEDLSGSASLPGEDDDELKDLADHGDAEDGDAESQGEDE